MSGNTSRLFLNAVMELHHTILEAFSGLQIQWHVTVTLRDQWNPVPNEHRGHGDDELVDRVRVKKRSDELATAHRPDIIAWLLSKTAHECPDYTVPALH